VYKQCLFWFFLESMKHWLLKISDLIPVNVYKLGT